MVAWGSEAETSWWKGTTAMLLSSRCPGDRAGGSAGWEAVRDHTSTGHPDTPLCVAYCNQADTLG